MDIFSKFFGDFMNQIINRNVGTKNKKHLKFSLDKNRVEKCDLFSRPVFSIHLVQTKMQR